MEVDCQEKVEDHVLKKYKLIEKVGSGSYGHVWKVLNRKTKETLALKKIFDAFRNVKDAQRTYREICILRKLQYHPNLVHLRQVIRAYNDRDIYLVFDYMECDLYSVIKQKLLKEAHMRFITCQIAQALKFLHQSKIVHRDLKPANILINSDCTIKLCDFGLSRFMSTKTGEELNMTEFVATRWYRSPEIIFGSHQYSVETDIWSFGCVVAEMLTGKPMFSGKSASQQIEKIVAFTGCPSQNDFDSLKGSQSSDKLELMKIKKMPTSHFFEDVSPEAIDLVYGLLKFNPAHRLTLSQVLQHPFCRDYLDAVGKSEIPIQITCDIDDNKRLPAQQYRSMIYRILKFDQEGKYPRLKSPSQTSKKFSFNRSSEKQNRKKSFKQTKSYWMSPQMARRQAQKIYSSKVSLHCSPGILSPNVSPNMSVNDGTPRPADKSKKLVSIYRKVVKRKT